MGINLVWACERCHMYAYSMRGEEGADFQKIVREHKDCFGGGDIKVYPDYTADANWYEQKYKPMWEYEDRPAASVA